jgi:ATP-dependent Lhr-like helicase
MANALDGFSPLIQTWFREHFGEPTPPQAQGWLPIQRGEHTLILAPTGSGKTLAAFLRGIDELFRALEEERSALAAGEPAEDGQKRTRKKRGEATPQPDGGIHLLYVSPLKALNNDIERNLRVPLEGIRETAAAQHIHLPHIRVAVRTGDTPAKLRAEMLKNPPHILITTPESLYLMLTSPRARALFRTTRTVIVDEIHTLAGNKRGAHLALTLERLQDVAQDTVQRIGLSATIRPLEEVARFLGGQEVARGSGEQSLAAGPRPVTVVDARYKKPLDLKIVTVVDDLRQLGGTDSIWPYVVPNVLNDIRTHETTLVFANSRRLAERTADRLNAQLEAEQSEEIPPGSPEALAPGGKMRDRGIFAIGAQGPIRAHHGSMSKESRHEMEQELKAGKLPALVGTSSLELGIDIGSIDLVVQLQSPKSVAQGLQRVGRSGHLVGETSRGKIYATFREDLAEAAAIVRGMLDGDVEPTRTPQNALDVLAQQIVACVAMQDWNADDLYALVRGAYPYHALPQSAYHAVLDMLTGKYFMEEPGARAISALRPKIAWDRVHNRLSALPGSRLLALSNVGTIPDTGQYRVYLADNKTRVGELDEEFVLETRVGDTFLLGSQVWRALEIKQDRVIVGDAAGSVPRMPFWHGDAPWRPFALGERIGVFRREVSERILKAGAPASDADAPARREVEDWLQLEYALDEKSARNLVDYVQSQLNSIGAISSDKTIIVESFQNAAGDPHLVIHSPFGGRVNGAWAVALTGVLRDRIGITPEVMTNDDGIIFRFQAAEGDAPPSYITGLSAAEARERILRELPGSAAFGAQFRMNAGRALLLSKPRAGKRTPFWLQRLKAKDLLAYVSRFPDFPILLETYRDVLSDVFDLPHLEQVLNGITSGEIRVVTHESVVPSPVASALMFNFVSNYLYEWDAPKAERSLQLLSVPRPALQEVMQGVEWSELLKPEALELTVARARHTVTGYQARSKEELAIYLREHGDLSNDELLARSAADGEAWIRELAREGRIIEVTIPTSRGSEIRWVNVELASEYKNVERDSDVLRRFLTTAGAVTRDEILARYAFADGWLDETLARLVRTGELAQGHFTSGERSEYIDAHLLEQVHRRTLSLLRGEVQPVSLFGYADFLARWQHAHPATRLRDENAVETVLAQMRGLAQAGVVWERDVLPARVVEYAPDDLEALTANGAWVWSAEGEEPKRMRVRFFARGEGGLFMPDADLVELSAAASQVHEFLKSEGASFGTDIQTGTRLAGDELASALAELTLRGLVTNDEMQTLRNLIAHGAVARAGQISQAAPRKPLSALEQELDARLGARPVKMTRYREAKRRTLDKIQRTIAQQGAPWRGRWTLTARAAVRGAPLSPQERAEKWARLLLARYGIVTREVISREEVPDLDLVYAEWQRLEWRGQARRGMFVAGMSGVQYALPDAVEQLRAGGAESGGGSLYVLNATDPANIFGGEAGELKFARVPSTYLVLSDGQPVLVAQENGERLTLPPETRAEQQGAALETFFRRPGAARHTIVTEWNGAPVLKGPGEALLKELGFYRIPKGMELWQR